MKTDFVTNSSSSSFIVMFDVLPKTAEELQKIMFRREVCLYYYEDEFESKDIAEKVFKDINLEENISNKEKLIKKFKTLIYHAAYEYGERNDQIPPILADIMGNRFRHFLTISEYGITNEDLEEVPNLRNSLYNIRDRNKYREILDKESELLKKLSDKAVDVFLKKYKDKHIVILEYADDGGQGHLEHGDIFKRVPHIKISNH